MNVDPKLAKFLEGVSQTPFAWGISDCSLWLADWWVANHPGDDPAAAVRGTYGDAAGKERLVARHRGLMRLVSAIAMNAGAARTLNPAGGDFGLMAGDGNPVGAICCGDGWWAFRPPETGLAYIRSPRILMAWSI